MTDFSAAQPAIGGRGLSVGAVIKRGFATYRSNFLSFTLLALILYLPTLFLTSTRVNEVAGESMMVSVGTYVDTLGGAALLLLSMVLTYVLVGALVFGAVQHLNGQKAGVGEIFRHSLTRIVPVVVIAILYSIACGIGFVLLVIPGIFVAVVWVVAIPAAVVERPGIIGSFKRSWDLTKGYRWPVLGLLLVLLVILTGFYLLIGVSAGIAVFALDNLLLVSVLNYVISAISGALMSVMIAVLYHDLRVAKEGVSTAQIAAVFD